MSGSCRYFDWMEWPFDKSLVYICIFFNSYISHIVVICKILLESIKNLLNMNFAHLSQDLMNMTWPGVFVPQRWSPSRGKLGFFNLRWWWVPHATEKPRLLFGLDWIGNQDIVSSRCNVGLAFRIRQLA